MNLMFNLVSAFTNTGFGSIDLNSLSFIGKSILVFLMYIGRIGPLTFFTMISLKSKQKLGVTYANADLML
jgi:trk system potassium uptake protein TrkH